MGRIPWLRWTRSKGPGRGARRRRGLAIEPMTCAPDAFNSGDGLLTIAPGESVEGRWGIRFDESAPGRVDSAVARSSRG